MAELHALAEQGKHEQVVAAVDTTVAALPPAARMVAWRIDYPPTKSIDDVLLGAAHAYLVHDSRRGGPRDVPLDAPWELNDARPVVRHDQQRYDEQNLVTCIDLATGNARWSRRFEGFRRFMVDPRNDDLWAMESQLFRLDADKGAVQLTVPLADVKDWRGLHGIRVDDVVIAHEHDRGGSRPAKLRLYDLDAQQAVELAHRPEQLSPNRLRVLVDGVHQSPDDVTNTVALTTFDRATTDWTYRTPGYSANDPVWYGANVLVLSGMADTRGAVALLDGVNGIPRWITVLPRGAYAHTHVYLPGNTHLEHTWDAIGTLGDAFVAAIDGRGDLVLLDPDSGAIRGRSTLAKAHFRMPRLTAQQLVVMAGTNALLAAPLDALVRRRVPPPETELAALVLKGRSLLALNRVDDARAVAERLTRDAPDSPASWRFAADVAVAAGAGDASAALAARVRAMELAGQERDDALLKSHGLLARIDTGPITAPLIPVGPVIYVGTRSGEILKIGISEAGSPDTRTGVVEKHHVPEDISWMGLRGNALHRGGSERKDHVVAMLTNPPPPPDPRYFVDPPRGPEVPREWTRQSGYDGAVVNHQGRLVRPLHNGHVRILESNGVDVAEHKTTLSGIESWNIYLGPGGPLGFGTGGVYRLDEQRLVPVEKLIDSGGERGRPNAVHLLAGDEHTVCFFSWRRDQPVLQLWTRDGKTKLREEPASSGAGGSRHDPHQRNRLIALRDGYFFSGDELVWLPREGARPAVAGDERPPWRFALWPLPRRYMRHHDLRDQSFGPPCVIDDEKIFVPCRDGGVFVFDVDRVTAQ